MITNKAFKRILNDKSITLTDEELENIIEDELLKPEDELDADLIEYCIDELERRKTAPKRKKGRLIKMLVPAAAAVVIILLSAPLLNNYFSDDYLMRGTQLQAELSENGFEDAILPEELLSKKCKIEKIIYDSKIFDSDSYSSSSSGCKKMLYAEIHIENNNEIITATIEKYKFNKIERDITADKISRFEEFEANGKTVYVFQKDGQNAVAYTVDEIQYVITLPFSYEETAEFAKNIK